jgi:hypothetical protein
MAPQGTLTVWQLLLQKIQVTFPYCFTQCVHIIIVGFLLCVELNCLLFSKLCFWMFPFVHCITLC